jgi:hypothetical protein
MGLAAYFALYGALHGTALLFALPARPSFWRCGLFIAMAAGLSVMTLGIGLFAGRLSGTLGNIAFYAVFGLSGMVGAVTYGILIRLADVFELTLREIALISCGCTLAAEVACVTLQSPSLGRWALPVLWWFAFSGGLRYCDLRRRAIAVRSGTDG